MEGNRDGGVFENRLVRKMFGRKTKAARRGWRKFKMWNFITCAAHWVRNNQKIIKRRKTENVTGLYSTKGKEEKYVQSLYGKCEMKTTIECHRS